jgi:hypothetical protein
MASRIGSPCTKSPGPAGPAQPVDEIEAQAQADRQRVFIVEYDQDRYVYLASAEPMFMSDEPQQDGGREIRWHAVTPRAANSR